MVNEFSQLLTATVRGNLKGTSIGFRGLYRYPKVNLDKQSEYI